MENTVFSDRINKLLTYTDDGIVIVSSGRAPMKSLDEAYKFSVDRNFYYLTGIDAQNMVLVMKKDGAIITKALFIERFDEVMARWVGPRLLKNDVTRISGIKNVNYIDELDDYISDYFVRNRGKEFKVYLDLYRQNIEDTQSFGVRYANKIKEMYPYANICDIFNAVAKTRMVKDFDEIDNIINACKITNESILAMMRTAHPFINECELEAVFDYTAAKNNVHEHSFASIVAGGKRATTLHYSDNNTIINDNELVLCDVGFTYNHYSSDITRTFPVNGKFNEKQKLIYNIVLEGQSLVIKMAKPGVTIKELNDALKAFYEPKLRELGLITEEKGISEYYFHNVSHHLGLDTHDVSLGSDTPLEGGNVITVEPGLYISDWEIGVRIEDDVLITDDGCKVISAGIIKTVEEIEEYMALNGAN